MEAKQIKVKVKYESKEGTLLHWGIAYEIKGCNAACHYTTAIIAYEDGTIREVSIRDIVVVTDKKNKKLETAAPDMYKALEEISNGCPPATAEEAFMFVDIAKSIAEQALKKATE